MLIGIIGGANTGKDTCFNILNENGDFENKKFAYKLKQMICVLLSCTMKDLEDREFKNKRIDWLSCFKLVTAKQTLYFNTIDKLKHHVFQNKVGNYSIEEQDVTPRFLMLSLGTDWGRELITPDIWVNALFADYVQVADLQLKGRRGNLMYTINQSNWIITDVRFENECKTILSKGGTLIYLHRPMKQRYDDLWDKWTLNNSFSESESDFMSYLSTFKNGTRENKIHQLLTSPSEINIPKLEQYAKYTVNNDRDFVSLETTLRDIKNNILKQ